MLKLYAYDEDFGRMGNLSGVFVSTDEELLSKKGKIAYFGEVLGKHSDIYTDEWYENVRLLTDDQDFIKKAIEYGLVNSGFTPLEYIDDFEDEE